MPPRIVTARSMGLRFRANQLATMGPETSVVGHYSAGPRAKNRPEGIARAKTFHAQHRGQGWAGIGYHYLIPDDGSIICCRSTLHKGSHVLRNNAGRIGVNMPGNVGDKPTRRQARAFWWLLHNAHTAAMPAAHRTDRDLSKVPRLGHKDLMPTACPGLFRGMYKAGGQKWVETEEEGVGGGLPDDDGFFDLLPEDEELQAELEAGSTPDPAADREYFGPDDDELAAAGGDDALELPPADDEFDEDLTELLAEIEGQQPAATG